VIVTMILYLSFALLCFQGAISGSVGEGEFHSHSGVDPYILEELNSAQDELVELQTEFDNAQVSSESRNTVRNQLQVVARGIGPNPSSPSTYIERFKKEYVFDLPKLKNWAFDSSYPRINFDQTRSDSKTVSGTSIVSMASDFSTKFSASGNVNLGAATISASLSAEYGGSSSSTSSTSFIQHREFQQLAYLSRIGRHHLRKLANPTFKEELDKVDSKEAAKALIEKYGATYIVECQFGGVMTLSSKSTSTKYAKENSFRIQMAAEYKSLFGSGQTDGEVKTGLQRGKEDTSLIINVQTTGGDPDLILNGYEKEWRESVASRVAIIDFRLAPISDFAEKGSLAERLVQREVEKLGELELGKFKVVNPKMQWTIGPPGISCRETCSIDGKTCYPVETDTVDQLIQRAENAHRADKSTALLTFSAFITATKLNPASAEVCGNDVEKLIRNSQGDDEFLKGHMILTWNLMCKKNPTSAACASLCVEDWFLGYLQPDCDAYFIHPHKRRGLCACA